MAYIINYELEYLEAKPEHTVIEWITNLSYSNLNGLFPEIAESAWSRTKRDIVSLLPPNVILGITPGLMDWQIDITEPSLKVMLTFSSKEYYDNYYTRRQNEAEYGLILGFPESTITPRFVVSDFITIQGRDIIDTRPGYSVTNAPIGLWLVRTFQLYRNTVVKHTHTQT
jgi:hypothetical protein